MWPPYADQKAEYVGLTERSDERREPRDSVILENGTVEHLPDNCDRRTRSIGTTNGVTWKLVL